MNAANDSGPSAPRSSPDPRPDPLGNAPSDAASTTAARLAGRFSVVSAAVMWSTSGFFAKAPLLEGWSGPTLAFWRSLFAAAVLLPFVRRPRWSWRLVPMLFCFTAMNWTFLSAMAETEAANAIWLQNTAPMWVFLIGILIFREPAQRRDWWLLLFCGLGVGFILTFELRGASWWGVIYGLLAGIFFGGVILSIRQLRDQEPFWLITLNHLTTVVLLSPYGVSGPHSPHGWQWLFLAAFGAVQMGAPYVLFARGLQRISSPEASGIVLLEPILVPVWVFLAWRQHPGYEAPAWWTLVGGSLILCGLAIRYVPTAKQTAAEYQKE